MKPLLFVLAILISLNFLVFTQTVHDIEVKNFSFTPSLDTIIVGDIVKWTNKGGSHSVVADDNSFTSGPVSSSAWVYEFTFNFPGTNPYYCGQHGGPGGAGMSGVIIVKAATDVKDQNISVYKFNLKQNFPNPFNPTTSIQYAVGNRQYVTLKVYNVLGNEVATLVNEEKPIGTYKVIFDAKNAPSGIYFYKLQAGNFIEMKKMMLLK